MLEPTSNAVGITAAAILLAVGPDGQYALIIFGGLVGVMHSVARVHTPSRVSAAWYVTKWVLTAALLTGFIAAMLQQYLGLQAERWPGVVAFTVTFFSDRWQVWAEFLLRRRLGMPDMPKEPEHD